MKDKGFHLFFYFYGYNILNMRNGGWIRIFESLGLKLKNLWNPPKLYPIREMPLVILGFLVGFIYYNQKKLKIPYPSFQLPYVPFSSFSKDEHSLGSMKNADHSWVF